MTPPPHRIVILLDGDQVSADRWPEIRAFAEKELGPIALVKATASESTTRGNGRTSC